MDKHYQLSITSSTTNIDVVSIDAEEVARIVQLAGLPTTSQPTPLPQEVPTSCAICGALDHGEESCPQVIEPDALEEIADYDHGKGNESEEIDVNDYMYKATRIGQHFGKNGDNTLNDPTKDTFESILENLKSSYYQYISETESRENEAGNLSPLSDPTKPEFDKDPFANEEPVDDGSHSPMSTIKRQPSAK